VSDASSLRIIGLTRKSQKGDDSSSSLAEQKRMIEERCAREGFTLLRVIEEEKVSGNKPWRSRGIGAAIKACEDGMADGIMLAYQDRLSREKLLPQAEIWDALEACSAALITCDGLDSRQESSKYLFVMKAMSARDQWERYQKGSNKGRGNSVLENNVHGGSTAPWGYEWTWRKVVKAGKEVDAHGPLTPAVGNRVAEAFEDIIAGISHRAFQCKYEIQMGHVVVNRVYLGEAKSGTYVKEGAHPALVDEDVFRRANRRFPRADKGGGRPSKIARPPALLPADVIRCGTCGHGLSRQRSSKGDHYRCQFANCDRSVSIGCDKANNYVLEAVLAWHAEDTALRVAGPGDADMVALEKALEVAKAQRAEVETMHGDAGISPADYLKALSMARAAVNAAGAAVSDAEIASGWRSMTTARVRERIEGDAEATRAFVRDFARAHVAPGTRWTPITERIALSRVWKYTREDVAAGVLVA
jgi:hypothetical protein